MGGININIVDTIGEGDCFTGGFAVAILEQMSLEDALIFANTAASLCAQKLGDSKSMPRRSDVEKELG